jgi:hypothetical protein
MSLEESGFDSAPNEDIEFCTVETTIEDEEEIESVVADVTVTVSEPEIEESDMEHPEITESVTEESTNGELANEEATTEESAKEEAIVAEGSVEGPQVESAVKGSEIDVSASVIKESVVAEPAIDNAVVKEPVSNDKPSKKGFGHPATFQFIFYDHVKQDALAPYSVVPSPFSQIATELN